MNRLATLAALLALLADPATAQTAFFNDPTDTIEVDGQTVIGNAATYEVVIHFPAGSAASGWVYNEWTFFQEDKLLIAGPNVVQAYNFPVNLGSALIGPTSMTLDTWHHVAFVYDGAEERIYVDGMLIASRSASGDVGDGDGLAHIGAIDRDGTFFDGFIGYLDSIRLSDVARYAGTTFVYPLGDLESDANTLLLFNFNEPMGSATVEDESPLGRTGTLGVGFAGATEPELGAKVVDVEATPGPVSEAWLDAPVPNPAQATTTVAFTLDAPRPVRLSVYDALGREVAVLVDAVRPAGRHEAALDGAGLPTGLYLVRLTTADGLTQTRRLTLLR